MSAAAALWLLALSDGLLCVPPPMVRPQMTRLPHWRRFTAHMSESDLRDSTEEPQLKKVRKRRQFNIWPRIRRRVVEAEVQEPEDLTPLLEGVSKDIDTAIAIRRRRLKAKLGSSLKSFREEVLNEVQLQANETKERQDRLKTRQESILQSLTALRADLLDEVEDGLKGVKRGSRTLEGAVSELRQAWEAEVNELVNDARSDVDLAVTDLEKAINLQRDEWSNQIARFDLLWLEQGKGQRVNASATGATTLRTLLPRTEIDQGITEVRSRSAGALPMSTSKWIACSLCAARALRHRLLCR